MTGLVCIYLETFICFNDDNSETVEREYIEITRHQPPKIAILGVCLSWVTQAVRWTSWSTAGVQRHCGQLWFCRLLSSKGSLDSFGNTFFNVGYDFRLVNEDVDDCGVHPGL